MLSADKPRSSLAAASSTEPSRSTLPALDALTAKVRDWVNDRRAYAGHRPLDELTYMAAFDADPVSGSMPPETRWVLGKLQYWNGGSIIQVDVPDFIHSWLAEWRAGKHTDYSEE